VPEFPVTTTSKPIRFSTSVECSRDVAEQLRLAALDGLLALPRVGMGIGGLLLGSGNRNRIRILDSMAIPCGHSNGPSFVLTSQEIAHALESIAAVVPLQVVGCYLSKTRGPSVLTEQVADLFQALCPAPWQVMLLLRPSTVDPSRAILFVRDPDGKAVVGGEQELTPEEKRQPEELDREKEAMPPVPALAARVSETIPQETKQPTQPAPPLHSKTAHPLLAALNPARGILPEDPAADRLPEPQPAPVLKPSLSVPRFLVAPAPTGFRRWLPWMLAAAALSASGATAWITRDDWLPRPELTLATVDLNGHLSIRWNPDAVRGMKSGLLSLNDGGDLHSYPLDRNSLENGVMGYDRKSPRVTATLRVGETRAIALFLDPTLPTASDPAPSEPASPPAVEKQKKIKQTR
jgi:hypothetical protein